MAPRDNLQELMPLTSGHANGDYEELESQRQKKVAAAAAAASFVYPDNGGKGPRKSVYDLKMTVLACLQIVGFGTLWRFPYVCLKYGGGEYGFIFNTYCTYLLYHYGST